MVATRRSAIANTPAKIDSDSASTGQATPASRRRTRGVAKPPESLSQRNVEEASSQLHKLSEEPVPSPTARKRCTRASRLHSPDKPCTPVSSVHEGDISDLESCCSVSEIELPKTRRSTRKRPQTVNKEDISDVESCSSLASASNVRRSARKKAAPRVAGSSTVAVAEGEDEVEGEPKSCFVAQSNERTRAVSRLQIEDPELSDAGSITESASTQRRSTRAKGKSVVDEIKRSSQSSALTTPRKRATRSQAKTASDVSMSCDSEGFESGPSYSRGTRRTASRLKVTESDSDLTDGGKKTPSSSRAGSGTRNRIEQVSVRDLGIVLEKSLEDSKLEMEGAECTLIEDNEEKEEPKTLSDPKQEAETPVTEESGITSLNESVSALEKEPADEPEIITFDHQGEVSAEEIGEASEIETMQETVQTPEQPVPLHSASIDATGDSQITDDRDEDMEVTVADSDISEIQNADVELMEGDQTEASSLKRGVQEVLESTEGTNVGGDQEGAVQATSSRQHQTSAEQPPPGVSLLDSSEDDDDDESDNDFADDTRVSSEDEDADHLKISEETGQCRQTEVAEAVEGLFMIDTRPGEDADEQYLRDGCREVRAAQEVEEEDDEDGEFVDEEGDSDDDAADVLFSSRNPHVKELSSRIDPGIRMKELGGLYISFDGSKSKPVSSSQQKTKGKNIQDEVMKKSVIGPDFEKKEAVPPYKESKHALKLKHRAERERSTGDAWFNMKAPEITPELKGDLQLLKMRGSMDSKRFYKKNDRDGFPKYFQMGTVVDDPVDFYHSRVSKKDRKRTMVEELLADAEFRQKNKKKFHAIMAEKAAQAGGRRRHKKNKFKK